jgi:hypothetical protein
MQNLQLELDGLKEKIAEVDTLLYSGKIKNPKELQEHQSELEELKRRQTNLEAQLRQVGETLASRQNDREEATQALEEAVTQSDEDKEALVLERDKLDSEIKSTLKKRKAKVKDIPDNILKQYRMIRKRKGGQGVALLSGNSCTACGIEQPHSEVQHILQDTDLVHCIGCGRILASH